MKIPLKTKVFAWYLRRGVILTKDNLPKRNWYGSRKCVFCHHDETIKHLFFQCDFARSIWSAIQIGSTLFPPRNVANIFGNWLNGVDSRFKLLIRVGAIAVIWSLWLSRNDKVFNDKILLLCRLSTGALLRSVHGRHCSMWSIATYFWRWLRGWRWQRRGCSSSMDGNIIFGSALQHLRRLCTFSF